MTDDRKTHQEKLRSSGHADPRNRILGEEDDVEEASCAAFGYLRGIRERADAIEVRFRNGKRVWFTYHWLGTWQFDPSEGLLLKFSGDLIYLVLIRGSNLDRTVKEAAVSLTQGLQERRVTWVREMSEQEAECVGEDGPTIDQIQWGQFDSQEAVINWLSKTAPAFVP